MKIEIKIDGKNPFKRKKTSSTGKTHKKSPKISIERITDMKSKASDSVKSMFNTIRRKRIVVIDRPEKKTIKK